MDRRLLLWGLGAGTFALTFALASWHDDLWNFARAPAVQGMPLPEPLSPHSTAAPAPAAVTPAAVAAATVLAASEPDSAGEVDAADVPLRGDRGAERGARSR